MPVPLKLPLHPGVVTVMVKLAVLPLTVPEILPRPPVVDENGRGKRGERGGKGDAVIYLSIATYSTLSISPGLPISALSPRRIAMLTPVGPKYNSLPTSVPM